MSKIFYRKQFSNYLGENRAINDTVVQFIADGPLPSPTPTPSITPTLTSTPTTTPTPTPSITPSITPTLTSTPTNTPSVTPTITPTKTTTPTPTLTPTMTPSSSPPPPYTIGNRLALDAASYPGAGNWNDISGNGNVISLINSPTYSSSNGGYFTFNGTNQYGTAPSTTSLNITGVNFTCEYWVKANTIGDYIIVAKAPWPGAPSYQNGNYMLWFADNYDLFFTSAAPGPTDANARNTIFTQDTNWHQIVYQYNAGVGTFYYDGTALTTTGPDGFNLFPTTNPLQIARRADGFGYLNGNLSIINIWDYALTSTQITQNWNYYRTRYGI